jgi:nucleoside-diphosphate kinase
VHFITSGPLVAMVWEGAYCSAARLQRAITQHAHLPRPGKGVVEATRKMVGATKPLESAPGTIRGDFGIDVGRNIIHASDAVESAKREIALWFKPEEVFNWKPTGIVHVYEKL